MPTTDTQTYNEIADNLPLESNLLKIHNQWKVQCVPVNGIKLRAGLFPSKKEQTKANILYLEGLADSMFNHDLLINTLSESGYRVIAFDYPGQGGSEGNMDQTRITTGESSWKSIQGFFENHKQTTHFNEFMEGLKQHKPNSSNTVLIQDMANEVWKKIKDVNEINPEELIDIVIGWSTGGLAAYEMAYTKKAGIRGVILLAPGTNTRPVIHIKTETLNGNDNFKHLDGIRPDSPLKIPGFSLNLLDAGRSSQKWEVKGHVKGLVLLSDPKVDQYVDSEKVESTLRRNTDADNFEFVKYSGAAHEIDNEKDEHRSSGGIKLEDKVVRFLDKIFT